MKLVSKETSTSLLILSFSLYNYFGGFPGGSDSKASACNMGDLGWKDPLEKEMATHSSTLAWKIPVEEPSRLQCMGLQRVDMTGQLHWYIITLS